MLLKCSFGAIFTDFCEIAMIISEPNIGKRIRRGLSHTFNHYFRLIFTIFLQLQYNCWKEISTFAEHFSMVRLGMTQNVSTRLNLCTFINCLLPWFRFIFYVHVYSLSILPYQFVITHSVLFTLCVCVRYTLSNAVKWENNSNTVHSTRRIVN